MVKYSLTFLETTPRDRINTLGPLDAGHQLLDASITGPDGARSVSLESKGSGFYMVPFGFDTRAGESYTVLIHYKVARARDTTTIDGIDYRVLSWAPVQWNLPIGEEIVRFITPIELPAEITQAGAGDRRHRQRDGVGDRRDGDQVVRPLGLLPHARRDDRQGLALGLHLQAERAVGVSFRAKPLSAGQLLRRDPDAGAHGGASDRRGRSLRAGRRAGAGPPNVPCGPSCWHFWGWAR